MGARWNRILPIFDPYTFLRSQGHQPPTLYTKTRPEGSGVVVVSEPLDEQREGWTAVPPQQIITVSAEKIETIPLQSEPRLTR